MNKVEFIRLLEQLGNGEWQAVVDGQSLALVDDMQLLQGALGAANAIIRAPQQGGMDAAGLRQDSLENAESLLANYYLTHPLTRIGFDHQATKLVEEFGLAAFAAPFGQYPARTLFVDGGEVVAEARDSPRHRYGAFCELENAPKPLSVEDRVRRWLERGEAHERYLNMNVCRYNC